jgi:hypothetical protein
VVTARFDWHARGGTGVYEIRYDDDGDWYTYLPTRPFSPQLRNAFGWFTLMDGLVRVSAGRIDRAMWVAPGAEGWDYSRGLGVRVELTPIDELNVGVFFRPSHRHNDLRSNDIDRAFLNTSLGMQFDAGLVNMAAGLELRSETERRRYVEFMSIPGAAAIGGNLPPGTVGGPAFDDNRVGVSAYLGVGINMIEDLDIGIGVQIANIDDLSRLGTIWVNQSFGFDLAPIAIGLDMHQKFYGFYNDMWTRTDLEFIPSAGFTITERTSVSAELPLTLGLINGTMAAMNVGFEPSITHRIGTGMTLSANYRLDVTSFAGNHTQTGLAPIDLRNQRNRVDNTVGLDFIWTF